MDAALASVTAGYADTPMSEPVAVLGPVRCGDGARWDRVHVALRDVIEVCPTDRLRMRTLAAQFQLFQLHVEERAGRVATRQSLDEIRMMVMRGAPKMEVVHELTALLSRLQDGAAT